MRRPSTPSSSLFHPLDSMLGTIARVRILRELCIHGGELSPSVLAERTGLSRWGASSALAELVAHGIVRPVGLGRSVPYSLNRGHPFSGTLLELFRAEAERVDRIMQIVRETAEGMDPKPQAVWLYGSSARGEDKASSDVDFAVIAEGGEVENMAALLREALEAEMTDPTVVVSVVALTRVGIERLVEKDNQAWERICLDAITLFGRPPGEMGNG